MQVVSVNEGAAQELYVLGVPVRGWSAAAHSGEVPLWAVNLWEARSRAEAASPARRYLMVWRRAAHALSLAGEGAPVYLRALLATLSVGGVEAAEVLTVAWQAAPPDPAPVVSREVVRGVVLRCLRLDAHGGRADGDLRVKVVSAGYDPTANVLCQRAGVANGAFLLADELAPAGTGRHYRVRGQLRPLPEAA